MPRGALPGEKRGAGRPPGSKNKKTIEFAKEIAASGETPLDYMLSRMRDITVDAARRDDLAKAAAPYVHPRLAATEHTGKGGGPIETSNATDRQVARVILDLLSQAKIDGGKHDD